MRRLECFLALRNGSRTDFRAFLLREERQELVDYFLEV